MKLYATVASRSGFLFLEPLFMPSTGFFIVEYSQGLAKGKRTITQRLPKGKSKSVDFTYLNSGKLPQTLFVSSSMIAITSRND